MESGTDWTWSSVSTNCVICSSPFERKPIIVEREWSEYLSEFKSAFRLFCKLLKSHKLESGPDEDERSDQWMMALSNFFASAWKIETMFQKGLEVDQFRTFTPPSCGNCYDALVDIYELQKLIEENQVSQRKLMDSLGKSLIQEKSPFEEKMKHQFSTSSSPPKKRRVEVESPFKPKSCPQPTTHRKPSEKENCVTYQNDKVAGLKACSVVLERCDTIFLKSRRISAEKDVIDEFTSSPRPIRKSKLKAFDVIRKSIGIVQEKRHEEGNKPGIAEVSEEDQEKSWSGGGGDDFCDNSDSEAEYNSPPASPSPKFPSGNEVCRKNGNTKKTKAKSWPAIGRLERRTRNKRLSLKSLRAQVPERNSKNREQSKADDDDPGSSLSSSEENPIFLTKERKRKKRKFKLCLSAFNLSHENMRREGKKRKMSRSMWLFLIRGDILFLRNSLIKISYEENQMICLEPGCESTVQGLDFSSFQQMREHIDFHLPEENYVSKERECPICETKFGTDLKEHLFKSHLKLIAVLCEVCRRPLKKTTFLPPHLWSHKSEEEKKEAKARGESETSFGYLSKLKSVKQMTKEMKAQERMRRKSLNVKLPRVAKSNFFTLVNEDTLIFKNSLIKVHIRKEMTCLEDNCGWIVNGIDSAALEKVKEHVGNHLAERGYAERDRGCPICSGERLPGHLLKNHLRTEHAKEISLICEVCWRPYNSATELQRHVSTHESGKLWSATTVEKEKKKEEKRRKKEEPKFPKLGPLKCFWKVSENLLLLKNSLVQVNLRNNRLECKEDGCGETFEGTDYSAFLEYRGHLNNCHLNEPNYQIKLTLCPLCHVLCDTKLKLHLSSDHDGCTMICEICWKPLEEDEDINAHIWSHKNEEEKAESLSEEVIEKFKEVPIRKEEVEGKGERIFQCETCGKQFTNPGHYRAHVPTHLPNILRRQFKCSFCGLKVLSGASLRHHISRKHRPDLQTSRVCPICSKEFHQRGSGYMLHMRSHMNERPFVCETCGKGFLSNESLKKHGNVHLDHRSFQCEYCEMAYKHQSNLMRHQKSVHADKLPEQDPEEKLKWTSLQYRPDFIGPKLMFPCEICEKVFPLRSRMTKHVRLIHPNNKRLKEENESDEDSDESVEFDL